MTTMDDFGAFAELAPLLALYQRLQMAGIDPRAASMVWVLPDDVLPGVTRAWDLPIERANVTAPTLGLRQATVP